MSQAEPFPEAHLKLGLVLEGGGALGLAHIGVIQNLEERHIRTSYIAGTSIGRLRAAFMPPADMPTTVVKSSKASTGIR